MSRATRAATAAVPLAAVLLPLCLPGAAAAASCREEIDDFERRLNGSALAAAEPDRYAELARAAEEAAELRDEELCMQRVAELNAALDEAEPVSPGVTGADANKPDGAAPPAPPLLLEATPVDYGPSASAHDGETEAEDDDQSE